MPHNTEMSSLLRWLKFHHRKTGSLYKHRERDRHTAMHSAAKSTLCCLLFFSLGSVVISFEGFIKTPGLRNAWIFRAIHSYSTVLQPKSKRRININCCAAFENHQISDAAVGGWCLKNQSTSFFFLFFCQLIKTSKKYLQNILKTHASATHCFTY